MLRSHRTMALARELAGAENTAMRRLMAVLPWQCPGLASTRTVLPSGRTNSERFRPPLGLADITVVSLGPWGRHQWES